MDRYQLSMDFGLAKRKADELEQIADGIRRLSEMEFTDTLNNLGNAWKGDNAQEYIRKGLIFKEKMKQTADVLCGAAGMIRAVARKIHDAEQEAVEIVTEQETFCDTFE